MSAPRVPVRILGLLGGLLLALAEFLTLFEIRSGSEALTRTTGGAHHGYALLVLGLAAWALTAAATRRDAARFVGLALGLVGVAAVVVVLTVDAPDLGASGVYENLTEVGRVRVGAGFFVESAGAVLVLAAGGLAVLAPRGASRGPRA